MLENARENGLTVMVILRMPCPRRPLSLHGKILKSEIFRDQDDGMNGAQMGNIKHYFDWDPPSQLLLHREVAPIIPANRVSPIYHTGICRADMASYEMSITAPEVIKNTLQFVFACTGINEGRDNQGSIEKLGM